MDRDRLDDVMNRSLRRARRRRGIARRLFALTVLECAIVFALVVLQPQMIGVRTADLPVWTAFFQPPLAFAGAVIGLAWMWRILRADPDPDPRAFRYHELDR